MVVLVPGLLVTNSFGFVIGMPLLTEGEERLSTSPRLSGKMADDGRSPTS
jgi:hypothetical protein